MSVGCLQVQIRKVTHYLLTFMQMENQEKFQNPPKHFRAGLPEVSATIWLSVAGWMFFFSNWKETEKKDV